jgi:DNA polymerase-3 subunit beta
MRFTISREALLRPLQVVGGVVEKRQTLPILSNILVQAGGGSLTFTGTDLEVELTATAAMDGVDSGETTLPARKFIDICRSLPEEATIEVSVEEDKATVKSGRSRFTLATLRAGDFPSTDTLAGGFEFEMSQGQLKTLIEQTQFCMANQDVRYYLNGMLLELDGQRIRAVATDGHRLAVSDAPGGVAGSTVKHQVIVPRKGITELGRLLSSGDEACTVKISPNHIRVKLGAITLTSKLIDGKFPDYERVIPKQNTRAVVADRDLLRQALSRAAILSNEKYRGIRLLLDENRLRAVVNNPEQEEAEEELEVAYSGGEFEIGFNVNYVIEALNAIRQEQVELGLSDANSSCLMYGVGESGARYVIMPMRL